MPSHGPLECQYFSVCHFNLPNINWRTWTTSQWNHKDLREFIDACFNFKLPQLVSEPTRTSGNSANINYLILTTHPSRLSPITYLEEISEYKVIHVETQPACAKRLRKQEGNRPAALKVTNERIPRLFRWLIIYTCKHHVTYSLADAACARYLLWRYTSNTGGW